MRSKDVQLDMSASYLITRGLAVPSTTGDRLENTEAGRQIGIVEWQPA